MDYNPRDIRFNTFPSMAKHIVEAMHPGEDGKVNKAFLWEGTTK
jgi:hypothetical protein